MKKLELHLKEDGIWKKIKEQNPDNKDLLRNIWNAAREGLPPELEAKVGNRKLFAANQLILMHESRRVGIHQQLLRGRR